MSHELARTHEDQTSHALSRRSFLHLATGTLTALPVVAGGVLVATPTVALAEEGSASQASSVDVLKVVAVRATDVCISAIDLTGGGRRAIVGANVKIISRYNDKTAEGTTDSNGVAVIRITDLAEKEARQRSGMYTFRARIEVRAEGYRVFKTGLAEITGGNGFETGTEKLQPGVPYPSRVSFDDWDILYSNTEFGIWQYNNYDHKFEIEFEGVAQTPLKVRITNNDDKTFAEGTTTPKGSSVTVSFGGRYLQSGKADCLSMGGTYLLQYSQGGKDYEIPLALVIRKGEGKMDDNPDNYKFYDFAPLSSVSKLLEFKIPDKVSVVGGTKIRLLPSLSFPIMFTIDPISGMYGLSINFTGLLKGEALDDQGNPYWCDYWGYKTDKGAPDPKPWSKHPYKSFSKQMEKLKPAIPQDSKDLYAKMKANAQSGSKNQKKYGIGHVKGGGTLDHQFKVSIWLNNFVKWQERDKVWQCLAGSVALNVNFEVSLTKHFMFLYLPMYLVIAFSVDATFAQMAASWIAKELFKPTTWQWDWGTRTFFVTITPKLSLTIGIGIKGFLSVSICGSISITATFGFNFRAAPRELPPGAAGKNIRYTVSAGVKIALNATLWLVSIDKTFDPWEAPNFIDNWRDSPSGMKAEALEELQAMAEESQPSNPLEYLNDPSVEYTVISERDLAALAEFECDSYATLPPAGSGPEAGPQKITEDYEGTTHTLTSIALPLFTIFSEEEYEEFEEEGTEADEGIENETVASEADAPASEGITEASESADATAANDEGIAEVDGSAAAVAGGAAGDAAAGNATAVDVAANDVVAVDAVADTAASPVATDVAADAVVADAAAVAVPVAGLAAEAVSEGASQESAVPQEEGLPADGTTPSVPAEGTAAPAEGTAAPANEATVQDVTPRAQEGTQNVQEDAISSQASEQPNQDDAGIQAEATTTTSGRYAKYDITRPYEFREVESHVDSLGSEGGLKPKYDQVIVDNILGDARIKIVDIEDTPHIFRIGVVMVKGQPRTRVICNQLDTSIGKYGIGTHVFDFPIQGLATGIGQSDDPASFRENLFDYDFDVLVDQRVDREQNAKNPVMGYINLVVVSGFRAKGTSTELSTLAKDQVITYACYFFRRRVTRTRIPGVGISAVRVRRTREFEDVTAYSVRADMLEYTTTYDGRHGNHMICCPKLTLIDPSYGRTIENDVVGFSPLLCSFLDRAAETPDDLFNSDESAGGATAIGIGLFFVSDHKNNGPDDSVQGKLARYKKLYLDFEDPKYISESLGPIKDYSIYGMELSGKYLSEEPGRYRSQWHLLQLFGSTITHPIFIRVGWEDVFHVPVISAIKKASLVSGDNSAAFEAAQLVPWKNGSYLATVNEKPSEEESEQLPAVGDAKSRLYRVDITDYEEDPKFVFTSVGLDSHAVQSFCIDTFGDTIFWPVMQDGAPIYDHDELGEQVNTGKVKNYYAIMASEFYSSTGYLDDAEGTFCEPYVFAETSHRMDTLAVSHRSSDVYDASNLRDTDIAFLSTELVDSKAGKGRLWYTSMPMVRSLTVIGVSAHNNTVIPGENVDVNIAVRNDGNQWLRTCRATILTKDGSTTLFDDMVVFDENTLMESQWNVRQEDGTLGDNKYDYWLAPGKSALYRITCPVPADWSGTKEIVARIQALQFNENNQVLYKNGVSAEAQETQPLEYLPVLDEEPVDYLTTDGEYEVETDELSQAPITVRGESNSSSGGTDASASGTALARERLPYTGDDTPLGGIGLALGAMGAAMLAYSKRRSDIESGDA